LSGRVLFRVAGSSLLSGKVKLAQDAADRGHVQRLAEPLLAKACQILARKCRNSARFGIGAGEHDANELGLLLGVELWRATVTRPVGEPVKAVLIVTDDPVAQRLPVGSETGAPADASFPAPASSNAARGFPALRSPVCFTSRFMGPILPERLSGVGAEPSSRQTAARCRISTSYSTVSSRSPFVAEPASYGA
jgi:hypothetical protein